MLTAGRQQPSNISVVISEKPWATDIKRNAAGTIVSFKAPPADVDEEFEEVDEIGVPDATRWTLVHTTVWKIGDQHFRGAIESETGDGESARANNKIPGLFVAVEPRVEIREVTVWDLVS